MKQVANRLSSRFTPFGATAPREYPAGKVGSGDKSSKAGMACLTRRCHASRLHPPVTRLALAPTGPSPTAVEVVQRPDLHRHTFELGIDEPHIGGGPTAMANVHARRRLRRKLPG